MTGMKRVWIACLLAIAGGGQLPLWLHRMVCHCPGHHATCEQSTTCSAGACSVAYNSAQPDAAACGHNHCHVQPSVAGDLSVSANETKQHVLRIGPSGDGHEDCAACYALSQQTVVPSFQAGLSATSFLPANRLTTERLPDCDLVRSYSSRAPPAI